MFCGDVQNQEYDSWFMQPKPITPIYNDKEELEDMAVYDESMGCPAMKYEHGISADE